MIVETTAMAGSLLNPAVTEKVTEAGNIVALAIGAAQAAVPTISIDLNMIFAYSSQILTMMMPIVGVGAGISFGFALVAYIIKLFRQIF